MPANGDPSMQYHQFLITLPEAYQNALGELLLPLGSLGMHDQGDTVTVYFPGSIDPAAIRVQLEMISAVLMRSDASAAMTYSHTLLPDEDWNVSWKQAFKPVDVGKRFAILPPWERYAGDRIPLIIDPGMAFGTGHHETTRSCLIVMEKYEAASGKGRFLDVGTGTGLLAIAAGTLGFKKIIAVDIDPLSIEASRRNIDLNRSQGIELLEGDISAAEGTYDMITANLIAGTLIGLAGDLAGRLQPSGVVIMSGILKGQDDEVTTASVKAGLRLVERYRDGKWVTLAFRR